jgi:hypothetical protein
VSIRPHILLYPHLPCERERFISAASVAAAVLDSEHPIVNVGDRQSAEPDSLAVFSGVGDNDVFVANVAAAVTAIEGNQIVSDLRQVFAIPPCQVHSSITQWKHQPLEVGANSLKNVRVN